MTRGAGLRLRKVARVTAWEYRAEPLKYVTLEKRSWQRQPDVTVFLDRVNEAGDAGWEIFQWLPPRAKDGPSSAGWALLRRSSDTQRCPAVSAPGVRCELAAGHADPHHVAEHPGRGRVKWAEE
jgi:hypothetical protein